MRTIDGIAAEGEVHHGDAETTENILNAWRSLALPGHNQNSEPPRRDGAKTDAKRKSAKNE
jgi:hypothetical protein